MRSARLLAVAVLGVVLALSSAQNAFAATISLTPNCGGPGTRVTFSGSGFASDIDFCAVAFNPLLLTESRQCLHMGGGVVSGYFVVSEDAESGTYTATVRGYWEEDDEPFLDGEASAEYNTDCPAVGGVVMPANTLALVAPWLAVIGLVGCISVAVVVAKKRQA